MLSVIRELRSRISHRRALILLVMTAACGHSSDRATEPGRNLPTLVVAPPAATLMVGDSVDFSTTLITGTQPTPVVPASCQSANPTVAAGTTVGGKCRAAARAAGATLIQISSAAGQTVSAALAVQPSWGVLSFTQPKIVLSPGLTASPAIGRFAQTDTGHAVTISVAGAPTDVGVTTTLGSSGVLPSLLQFAVKVTVSIAAPAVSFPLTIRAKAEGISHEVVASLPLVIVPGVGGDPRFQLLASGQESVCGLTTSRVAACWGYNVQGQLGITSDIAHWPSSPVSSDATFMSMSSGDQHVCALTVARETYCWGLNTSGQLGDGTPTNRFWPTVVGGSVAFVSVAAGGAATCGLSAAGAAYCWGDGYGRDPVAVPGGSAFDVIAVGRAQICGITTQGSTLCWPHAASAVPLPVSGGRKFSSITIGWDHMCGLDPAGAAYCSSFSDPLPQLVPGRRIFKTVAAGGHHTCGLDFTGQAFCWRPEDQNGTPIAAAGSYRFVAVVAAVDHNCGLMETGQVYCWDSSTTGLTPGGPPDAPPVP